MERRTFVKKAFIFNLSLGLGLQMVSCYKDENISPASERVQNEEDIIFIRKNLQTERVLYVIEDERHIRNTSKKNTQRVREDLNPELYRNIPKVDGRQKRRETGIYVIAILLKKESINLDKLLQTNFSECIEFIDADIIRINYLNPTPLLRGRRKDHILNCVKKNGLLKKEISFHKINI